tara:strand:- start:60191 stop:60916 length:726 start_codon:yes stop_codon:yes gene_type:complete
MSVSNSLVSSMNSPIIVALDYPSAEQAVKMAGLLSPEQVRVKVGKELFTRSGPAVVEALQKKGFDVFLDLKFHDIPNTVAGAIRAAADLGVWMVNVHACGGRRMMEAAREAVDKSTGDSLLTAVTVLTSMGTEELAETGVSRSLTDQVCHLAELAQSSGMDGVVCSAQEAPLLRDNLGKGFALVTPGIRPAGADRGDQTRIVTPAQALAFGVSYMVIGRPITQADSPTDAVAAILQELSAS